MLTAHDQDEVRTELVLTLLPEVAMVAKQIGMRHHSVLETDDLFQDGVIGLIGAALQFDPTRGVSFEGYATHRIRGAMRDALRQFGTPGYRATGYDPDAEDFHSRFMRHEQQRRYEDGVSTTVSRKNLCEKVSRLVMNILPERTQHILTHYYSDGWSLATIGCHLGMSEGRVSKIHAAALKILRRRLGADA